MSRQNFSIKFFPDPILRKKTKKITQFDRALRQTVERLDKVMRSEKHGIGIAAPQIGVNLSLAIVDVSARVKGARRLVLCNPKIKEMSHVRPSREGCMSIPDYTANIKRFDEVFVEWVDECGKAHSLRTTGIEAVCIQHEVDHLNGQLFIDRVISLKKDMIPRKAR